MRTVTSWRHGSLVIVLCTGEMRLNYESLAKHPEPEVQEIFNRTLRYLSGTEPT